MIVGVVGAGKWGTRIAQAVSDLPGLTLGGVVETCEQRRTELGKVCGQAVLHDLDGYLAVMKPDAVIVATNPEAHSEVVAKCARAGVKKIRVEKPVGTTRREAAEILYDTTAVGIGINAGYQMLDSAGWRFIQSWLLATGATVRKAHSTRLSAAQSCGRDVWLDLGVHGFAYAASLGVTNVESSAEYNHRQDIRKIRLETSCGSIRYNEITGEVITPDAIRFFSTDHALQSSLMQWAMGAVTPREVIFRVHELVEERVALCA